MGGWQLRFPARAGERWNFRVLKRLRKYFVSGVITIVPIGIVVWVIIQLFNFFDNLLGSRFTTIDHHDIPGLGLLLTLALITLAGALSTHWFSRRLFVYADLLLKRVPLIKSVYGVIKDTVESFVGYRQGFQRVVLVHLPGYGAETIGFVTRPDGLPELGEHGEGKIAVFVPLSFQMTGLTLVVPESDVKTLPMTVEQGIRYTLSAGLARGSPHTPAAGAPSAPTAGGGRRNRKRRQPAGEPVAPDRGA